MKYYTTKEVAEKAGIKPAITRRWAMEHGVSFIGEGVRKNYLWSEKDLKAFLKRNKQAGRPPTKK